MRTGEPVNAVFPGTNPSLVMLNNILDWRGLTGKKTTG